VNNSKLCDSNDFSDFSDPSVFLVGEKLVDFLCPSFSRFFDSDGAFTSGHKGKRAGGHLALRGQTEHRHCFSLLTNYEVLI
jgi:hypothetical protein